MKMQNLFDEKILRSPLFYVGDKFKLMPQLKELFPKNINTYIEPFVGGGSSFLNVKAKKFLLNDIDTNLINLHKFLQNQNTKELFAKLFEMIEFYNLSCSLNKIIPPLALRMEFKKTYFARYNKSSYHKLRADFNADKSDMLRLYLLLIYGFNHMLRFNSKGEFNLPVGNVDFNANVINALADYLEMTSNNNLSFFNLDYLEFLENLEFEQNDFIYFDPPYLISNSEYNKFWNELCETTLYQKLDELNAKGVKWGLTNLLHHKNKHNEILENFVKNYKIYTIKSNYISFNDNSIKQGSREIYVSNA